MAEKGVADNLKLWAMVEETDPKFVKKVEYGKNGNKRKFSSIDAYYQIKRATSVWGPYGAKWGLKDIEISFLDVPTYTKEGKEVASKMALYKATFFFPDGEFVIHNAISIKDDEFMKKVETDTLTKALSRLGFNADVFMGRFDSNRYVPSTPSTPSSNSPNKQSSPSQSSSSSKPSNSGSIEEELKSLGLEYDPQTGEVKGKTYGKNTILKKLGFKWNPDRKVWYKERNDKVA